MMFGGSFYVTQPIIGSTDGGGGGGDGTIPPSGSNQLSVYSSTTQIHKTVYMNGRTQLNGEVWRYAEFETSEISGLMCVLRSPRTSGTLDVTVKKGATVLGTGQFNAGEPSILKIGSLDTPLTTGDIVTVEMVGTGFAPLNTQIDLYLAFN